MAAPNEGQMSGFVLECPSSPFDHQASFVSFSGTIPPHTCLRSVVDTSKSFPPSEMETKRSPRNTQEYQAVVETGISHLAASMGYHSTKFGIRESQLIQADALTLIEKLTVGKPITKRPRDLEPWEVRARLQRIIPDTFFESCGSHFDGDAVWKCDQDALSEAAASYITGLKRKKELQKTQCEQLCNKTFIARSPPRGRKLSEDDGDAVQRSLTRLQKWCDDWIAGRIAEEDWDKMGERV